MNEFSDSKIMEVKHNSLQEKIFHVICSNSLGYMDIFIPNYINNRELCDLVWQVGEDVIIFYCQSSVNRQGKQDKHNFNQAKNWLNKWNDEIALEGQNSVRKFKVFRKDVRNIFVVSVTESKNPQYRPLLLPYDFQKYDRVCCVSFPFKALKVFLSGGASSADLAWMCSTIAAKMAPGVEYFIQHINSSREDAIKAHIEAAKKSIALNKQDYEYKIDHGEILTRFNEIILNLKSQTHTASIIPHLRRLGSIELIFLSSFLSVGHSLIKNTLPGDVGPLTLSSYHHINGINWAVRISANYKIASDIDQFEKSLDKEKTIYFNMYYSGLKNEHLQMFIVFPQRLEQITLDVPMLWAHDFGCIFEGKLPRLRV